MLLFLALLAANAAISFPYTKNLIMNPAGVFFALAVFAASRTWLSEVGPKRLAVSATLFAVLTCGWTFRVAGLHYGLRRTAALQRAEWVHVDDWLTRQRIALAGPEARALRDTLQRDAVWVHPTPFQPSATWARWFDIDW